MNKINFFSQEQFKSLCITQDLLNQVVNPDWKTQLNPWWLAITDEVMEFNNHLGWQWWKKGSEAKVTKWQLLLEVADMLCFSLSEWIEGEADQTYKSLWLGIVDQADRITEYLAEYRENSLQFLSREYLRRVMQDCPVALVMLCLLAEKLGYTVEQLHACYMAKVALNKFRQDNGYKTGGYQKEFRLSINEAPKEDNAWLEQVIQHLESVNEDFTVDNIYKNLEHIYGLRVRSR